VEWNSLGPKTKGCAVGVKRNGVGGHCCWLIDLVADEG
jgi:hypothetical protein